MLLVSGVYFTTWIRLCPPTLVEEILNAMSTKSCLVSEEHLQDKE
jgi:hypothetical protein